MDKSRVVWNEDAYKFNGFNQLKSDEIPVDRMIPDLRNPICPTGEFEDDLPTTSVIITFHNELRSTILRTIVSLLRTTPPDLLKEIILVDDASEDPSVGLDLVKIEVKFIPFIIRKCRLHIITLNRKF